MRLTLEQLKAMDDDQLLLHWRAQKFPFEIVPSCNKCVTLHWQYPCFEHKEFSAVTQTLTRVDDRTNSPAAIRANLEQIYALRLFYDHLYRPADQVPEALAMNDETLRGVQA